MKLKLHNILKIENADIEIGGLTVLAGENDSGKSTVGKVLFSLLKALNNVRQIDRLKTVSLIRRDLFIIKRYFQPEEQLALGLNDLLDTSIELTEKSLPFESFSVNIERMCAEKTEISTRGKAMLNKRLNSIRQHILRLDNPEEAVRDEFELIAKSEFMEPIQSFGSESSYIHFHDDTANAEGVEVSMAFIEGKVSKMGLNGDMTVEDVTYIESPLYLHILNTLRMSSPIPTASLRGIVGSLHKENIPFHLADMADKILNSSGEYEGLLSDQPEWENFQPLLRYIESAIGGEFVVDQKSKQLSFIQNGHKVPPVSVASGIKSFGVLQRLIQTDNVSTSKMLVWDEPEIHLHPEWQVIFCRLIIELVSLGIPIVVSSHSPYFVQGLRYFAAAKGIEKDVKYYLAEKFEASGLSTLRDVTDDLNSVFTLLAAPLREIMNVDAIRNKMK